MVKLSRRENYAKLAGFFEGEGCIMGIRRHGGKGKSWTVRVSIGQVIRRNRVHECLKLFKKIFGGNIHICKKLTQGGKKKCIYLISDKKAIILLKILLPFLSEKQDRAKLAIKLGSIKLRSSNQYIRDPKREKKQKLAEEIKKLNHLK